MLQSSSSAGAMTDRYIPAAGPGRRFALIWTRMVLACLTCEPVKRAALVTGTRTPAVPQHWADGRGGYG